MDVEIPAPVREAAAGLGDGVPYALKALAGRLSEDPDPGRPSTLPGILEVGIDGDTFQDCPALVVGYVREPDRIEIRYVSRAQDEPPADDADDTDDDPDQGHIHDAADEETVGRQIADAWARITGWLAAHAPASYAALRSGAGEEDINALEGRLGTRVPAELRALWRLSAGDDGVCRAGCLPGNMALMPLEKVEVVHRMKMQHHAHLDAPEVRRLEEEGYTVWKAWWIPVIMLGPEDSTSGWYLDAESGFLGPWSRYNDNYIEERDTLVTYLEEAADMLEYPALATRDRPGLLDGRLVWIDGLPPAEEDAWQPLGR
ncbi:SMI1/KNR4 family protein [Streptomyces sp. NPDC089799]|uniref:SMI1/KNR4 family protein n=1 Tax=Streptomyces sp. NPDC089799 TaxID=3155066 RepID=UPI00342A024F